MNTKYDKYPEIKLENFIKNNSFTKEQEKWIRTKYQKLSTPSYEDIRIISEKRRALRDNILGGEFSIGQYELLKACREIGQTNDFSKVSDGTVIKMLGSSISPICDLVALWTKEYITNIIGKIINEKFSKDELSNAKKIIEKMLVRTNLPRVSSTLLESSKNQVELKIICYFANKKDFLFIAAEAIKQRQEKVIDESKNDDPQLSIGGNSVVKTIVS